MSKDIVNLSGKRMWRRYNNKNKNNKKKERERNWYLKVNESELSKFNLNNFKVLNFYKYIILKKL